MHGERVKISNKFFVTFKLNVISPTIIALSYHKRLLYESRLYDIAHAVSSA
jgi:hypothetical protein